MIALLAALLAALLLVPAAGAQAPPRRSGIPYAEAALCARPDVVLCEDFEDQTAESGYHFLGPGNPANRWANPALRDHDSLLKTQVVARSGAADRLACPACPGGTTTVLNPPPVPGIPGVHSLRGDYLPPFANNSGAGGRLRTPLTDFYVRYHVFRSKAGMNGDAADFRWPSKLDDKDVILNPVPPRGGGPADAPYEVLTYLTRDAVCKVGDSFRYQPGVIALVNSAKSTVGSTTLFGEQMVFDNRPGGPRVVGACPPPGAAQAARGRWQSVELHVKLNDPGKENGQLGLWVDGARIFHVGTVVIRGEDPAVTNLTASFTYGDGLQCIFKSDLCAAWAAPFHKWLDNLVIATRPIGPGGAAERRRR
ncbi:MAG: polysaccharide lyase [Candidatus Methylomirabilales bacterium]